MRFLLFLYHFSDRIFLDTWQPPPNQDKSHVLARFSSSTNISVVKDGDVRISMGDGDASDWNDPDCPERKVDVVFVCKLSISSCSLCWCYC
jgi:hypothetical protein